MILVHDEHWDKDHGIDSEVNPESEDDIRNILFDVVGLSLYQSFFNSFLRSDIPMGFGSKIEVPERSCQNHCDALATAPDADVDQERIEICKHADDYSCFSVVVLISLSVREYSVEEEGCDDIQKDDEVLPEELMVGIGGGHEIGENGTVAVGMSFIGRLVLGCV